MSKIKIKKSHYKHVIWKYRIKCQRKQLKEVEKNLLV